MERKLRWGESTTISKLGEFVKLEEFTKYKIVLINFLETTTDSNFIFEGIDYEFHGIENIIYLYFDPERQHFAAISSIISLLKSFKKRPWLFCHRCSTRYSNIGSPNSCRCGDGIAPPTITTRLTTCIFCGDTSVKGKRKSCCEEATCQSKTIFFNFSMFFGKQKRL